VASLPDRLSPPQRSALMAKVRGTRNRSTDMRVAAFLIRAGIRGWKRHWADLPGKPDFAFPELKLAIFVDGCFWHGCPSCRRNVPRHRQEFWRNKIVANRRRDRVVERLLRALGYRVLRIWEHDLAHGRWRDRLGRVFREARALRDDEP
jgi:DNA mismatch endonuclease (patch repair protein)